MKGNQYGNNTGQNFNNRSRGFNSMMYAKLLNALRNQTQPQNQKHGGAEVGKQKSRDWQDYVGLGIQGILAVFTAGLFYQTQIQLGEVKRATAAAVKSADAAVGAVDAATKANEISRDQLNLAIKEFESNNISGSKTLGIATRALATQIAANRENQRQFNAQNQAILHLSDFKLNPLVAGQRLIVLFRATYSGSLPAQIISSKSGWVFAREHYDPFRDTAVRFNDNMVVGYVGSQPVEMRNTSDTVNEQMLQADKMGWKFIFFGVVEYINPVTKDKMRYRYSVYIKPDGYMNLLDENSPMSNSKMILRQPKRQIK
jgi:hypothetical protein